MIKKQRSGDSGNSVLQSNPGSKYRAAAHSSLVRGIRPFLTKTSSQRSNPMHHLPVHCSLEPTPPSPLASRSDLPTGTVAAARADGSSLTIGRSRAGLSMPLQERGDAGSREAGSTALCIYLRLHNLLDHGDTLLLLETLTEHGAGLA